MSHFGDAQPLIRDAALDVFNAIAPDLLEATKAGAVFDEDGPVDYVYLEDACDAVYNYMTVAGAEGRGGLPEDFFNTARMHDAFEALKEALGDMAQAGRIYLG